MIGLSVDVEGCVMGEADALFGVDGTQLPEPMPVLFDPLTGLEPPSWRATLPVPPPPALNQRAMHEAISAVFGADPAVRPQRPRAVAAPPVSQASVFRSVRQTPAGSPVRAYSPATVPVLRPFKSADPRGRFELDLPRRTPKGRSGTGTRAGCVIALIIFAVVVVNIVAGILRSTSGFGH